MNITPQYTNTPIPTVVNPATENLRRENNQREVITQPAALSQSAADKGVGSDKSKSPTQQNEHIDFANIRKRAEQENNSINDSSEQNSEHADDNQQHSPKEQYDEFIDEKKLHDLKQSDMQVRTHELAHAAVGGATTGAPSYTFEIGPDGRKYAVSGEVSVDLSKVDGNPRATIAKMQKIHAAALAPANPSIQDTRVAAAAANIIAQEQSELLSNDLQSPNQASAAVNRINPDDVFQQEVSNNTSEGNEYTSNEFEQFITQTLKSQEAIAPTRSQDVLERANRIEHFYLKVNRAYEQGPSHQFELTA